MEVSGRIEKASGSLAQAFWDPKPWPSERQRAAVHRIWKLGLGACKYHYPEETCLASQNFQVLMKTNLLTLQELAAGSEAAHSPASSGMEFPAEPGQMWAS